jgi:hypothetical protein
MLPQTVLKSLAILVDCTSWLISAYPKRERLFAVLHPAERSYPARWTLLQLIATT